MQAGELQPQRLASLDQFRGYTVLGMFLVNFVGHFQVIARDYSVLKHHNNYCSYADTIMPHFFFAVGFAYRLTLLRRLETLGPFWAFAQVLRRNLGLILLGAVIYHLDGGVKTWEQLQALGVQGFLAQAFQRNLFQTLVHIGVTALWVMPVIAARPSIRIAFMGFSALVHVALSYWFYYEWVHQEPKGIDGGPLGFLTWTLPLLAGSLAYDLMAPKPTREISLLAWSERKPRLRSAVGWLILWGFLLMVLGYGLSCLRLAPYSPTRADAAMGFQWAELPFLYVPPTPPNNLCTMSQRAGSVSYLMFGAGLSLAVYALFVLACDLGRLQIGILRTLGTNALAGYIIHDLVDNAMKPYLPKDAPLWFAVAAFGVFLGINYLFIRYLEKNRLYLRL